MLSRQADIDKGCDGLDSRIELAEFDKMLQTGLIVGIPASGVNATKFPVLQEGSSFVIIYALVEGGLASMRGAFSFSLDERSWRGGSQIGFNEGDGVQL
jgi:hypothetical protein